MAKHIKTIISLMMTLAMLLVSVPMMSAIAETDPASLIVEDIDTYTKAEAEGKTVFVSDHRAESGNVITGFAFLNSGSSGSYSSNNGQGRKFYINDYGYGDNRNLEITYRPTTTGEYIVTRTGSSGTYTADTYVERYVGDRWGYNGFMYTNKSAVPTLYKDVSAAEGGYAVYTIEVLDGSSVDDAYLAVTFIDIDDSWLRSDGVTHRGVIVAGVPLADYYDTEAMGKQTVLVPLSAFDFKDERVFLDCATANGTREDYDIYDNYDNYRATKAVQWDGFTGMGIARNDTDAGNVESFQYVAYNLAIVGGYEAPVLSVDAASSTLSWTASGYADTTYTITKGDGTTIDAGTATSYVDTAMADGDTYTVTSNVSVTSANTNNVTYEIPATSEAVTVTAGNVVEKEDGTTLIIADIDTLNNGDARATNIFVGDHYAQSGGTVNGLLFYNQNSSGSHYTNGVKDGRQFYIHDTGYDDGADTPKGRAITYRPATEEEEYIVSRTGGSGTYEANAYVKHYVGGTWGFQGYVYEKNGKDLTSAVDDGYAVFSIEVKNGSSVDDAYLAITFADADAGWKSSTGSYYGQIVVGVPLADYYDTEAMGKQTVYVPLSAFDVKNSDVLVGCATIKGAARNGKNLDEYLLYTDPAAWRAQNDIQWDTITGIGWARNDTDGDSSDSFTIIAHNAAFVDGYTAPVLEAAYDETAGGNVLSWSDCAYEGATYTITKTDGKTTETIDAGTACTYTDTDLTADGYTYTVTANAPATSVMVNTPVYEIPATSNEVSVTVHGGITDDPVGEVVEKTVEVEKFSFNPGVYSDVLAPTGYYIGTMNEWGDYSTSWAYENGGYKITITDSNGDSEIAYPEQNSNVLTSLSSSGVKDWGKTTWGYEGFKLGYNWATGNQAQIDAVPDECWGNVFNVADYMNNGYAVFEIELGANNTTTDGVYLALSSVKEEWALANLNGNPTPVTKEAYPDVLPSHFAESIIGVPLSDYYDVAKGGNQIVAVPLSAFVNNPAFADMYGKAWNATHYNNIEFKPGLFDGMGIVKDDVDTSEITTTQVYLKNLKIAAVQAPKNLSVTDKKGKAYITWDGTTDKDTTYSVVKKIGGEVEYIAVGTDNKYTDSDVLPGATYTYSVVAVHTGTGANLKSPESNTVTYASSGEGNPTEFVDAVTVDYEPNTYGSAIEKRYAAYYVGANSTWNDYESSWVWQNGGYLIRITDNDGDGEIDIDGDLETRSSEINPNVERLSNYGTPDGVKNWGKSTWGYIGFNLGYNWNLGDAATVDAVPDAYWGNIYDMSGDEDSTYIVYEINVTNNTSTRNGLYLAAESVLSTDYLLGYDSAAGLPVSKVNQPKMKSTQAGASGVFGVPLGDYYDFEKGGYQTIRVPVSAFINNPEFVDVFGKSGFGLNKYNENEVKFQPALFTGAGLVKDDQTPGALEVTKLEAQLKKLQVMTIEAPAYVVATLDGVDVALTWPISATTGVTGYEVYRNDELIATVATNYYKDTAATGNLNNTYSVKAVYGDTGMTSKATYTSAIDIPVAAVKLYTGSGSTKAETQYVTDGTMTVSGYSVEAGNTLYAARYNAEGELVEVMPTVLPASAWTDVVFNNVVETDIIRGYIWNTTSFAPVTVPFTFKKLGIKSYEITYPTYGKKAVTFNINDAAATDAAVIELMHQYGINATFGLTDDMVDYSMYVHDDFEIANHTTHIEMYLTDEYEDDNGNLVTPPTYEECVASIETAEAAITSGAGTAPAGMAWPYFAPEERSFYNQLKTYAATNGYDYIRDSRVTGTFDMPIDWLDWGLTGYVQADNTEELLSLADTFRALSSSS